jgi:hypothetical protein
MHVSPPPSRALAYSSTPELSTRASPPLAARHGSSVPILPRSERHLLVRQLGGGDGARSIRCARECSGHKPNKKSHDLIDCHIGYD